MSLWSAERLRVGLAPDRVELVRQAGRPGRPGLQLSRAVAAPTSGDRPWQAALESLGLALSELDPPAAAVAVVLSNHWVRYAVLPWQPQLSGAAEIQQLARLHFERVFGAMPSQWTIRVGDGGYGQPHVACAVDSALIDGLRQCLASHALRLTSLQPLLMAAFNDMRRTIAGRTAFSIVEPGRICMGLLEPERWLDIASRRTWDDPAEAIEQELATLPAERAPDRIDVVLVGEGIDWRAREGVPSRLLAPAAGQDRLWLAQCGAR